MQKPNEEPVKLPDPVVADLVDLMNKFEIMQYTGTWAMAVNCNPTAARDFQAALVAIQRKYVGE